MAEKRLSQREEVLADMEKRPLFFDLETAAHPRVEEWITREEVDLTGIKAPSNYKDPHKIGAYVRDAQNKLISNSLADHEDRIAKAPLDADYGVIRAIGYREGPTNTITVLIVPQDLKTFEPPKLFGKDHEVLTAVYTNEAEMLQEFWTIFARSRRETVGYNSIGFDFPYLLRRSMDLKIKPKIRPDLRRYQLKNNLDLMGILFNWGRAKGMKFVCERYGIENPNPELDGSKVAGMDDYTLIQYAAGDIYMLTEIYWLMDGVYW